VTPKPWPAWKDTDDSPPPIPPRERCKDRIYISAPQGIVSLSNHLQDTSLQLQVAEKNVITRGVGGSKKVKELDPLYQTYREMVTEEIKTVCHLSKCVDDPTEWRTSEKGGNSGVLWQELPAVRLSGALEQLSPAECKHQESMFEVLTSEASYLRSLRVLTEHFMESRELNESLIIRDKKTLFSNILRVREASEKFLKALEDRVEEGLVISDICDIIHHHAQHSFPTYIDYVRNQTYQEKIYSTLMQRNMQFATVISRLQESPQCQRLPFISFLLLPFQRITRIKMLTENILKRTKEGSKQERTASEALLAMSKIVKECNTQVGKMKQMEELIHTAKMLDFNKLKAVPVISQSRYLEKRGELQELAKGGTMFSLRSKYTPIYLLLFNDLLILTTKRSNSPDRYVVMDHTHRSLVQVQSVTKDSHVFKKCFFLIMLENHQGRMTKRLLKAPTESDMHRWMAAFPNPTTPKDNIEEVVYADWDCPQVQCVEQYVAQQADELNLEPTDIINVVRKTNEGWYEGIRLSDGEAGWFPATNVVEITNEHVRRRNLREQYRVAQATAHLA
ncbi:rho guanine nucleotide exchange factor 15, partial [Arapaima gigas]